jgi:cytosine/adenosine deaminase-related metal-dependent hydrolase
MKFGIHHSSWLDRPDPAEAFEAVKAKARWAEDQGFVWFSVLDQTLIDGSGGDPVPNRLLVVEGNRITLLGETDGSMRPETPDDTVIDATGKFILPGLIDAHCHPLSLVRGTDGSNLLPSSGESVANPTSSPCRPQVDPRSSFRGAP